MSNNEKAAIRREALIHRARISNFNNEDTDLINKLFFDVINPNQSKIIGFYWPVKKEIDPTAIVETFIAKGGQCALPVIQEDSRILKFALWQNYTAMIKGPMGIMQPVIDDNTRWVSPDILLVPLLAFDRKGHRLGYGGGYYDATIRALREVKDVLAVGIGYAQQAVIFNLPAEEHDQRLDWVITPHEARCFVENGYTESQ
jgi:5-formyltetrahydrofolate cyclo-ligase